MNLGFKYLRNETDYNWEYLGEKNEIISLKKSWNGERTVLAMRRKNETERKVEQGFKS